MAYAILDVFMFVIILLCCLFFICVIPDDVHEAPIPTKQHSIYYILAMIHIFLMLKEYLYSMRIPPHHICCFQPIILIIKQSTVQGSDYKN